MTLDIDPFIIWLFGIPGSGKSTMAMEISKNICIPNEILDSDELREKITPRPTWSNEERTLLYNSIVEIASRLFKYKISIIISASAGGVSLEELRNCLPKRTFYVYLDCELKNAFKRHPKNLYVKAKKSDIRLPLISGFKNIEEENRDIEFAKANKIKTYKIEMPENVDLVIDTNYVEYIDINLKKILNLIS